MNDWLEELKLWYVFMEFVASLGGQMPDIYNPDATRNTAGPAWRRGWDVALHPRAFFF